MSAVNIIKKYASVVSNPALYGEMEMAGTVLYTFQKI